MSNWIHPHRNFAEKKSLAIMMTCVSPAVVIFDFHPSRHRHTVTVVINEKNHFYEFNTKRNRIAVEKAIQQKSLVFSPPVSATTTLTHTHTHTSTNTNTNTPETNSIGTSNETRSHWVDHKMWRHVCGGTPSIPAKGAFSKWHKRVRHTTTIGISTQSNFIRNFVIRFDEPFR